VIAMQPTKPWVLAAVAAVTAGVSWLLVSATFANLPPLGWNPVPAMALLAIGEFMLGRNLRSRLSGERNAKPVQPMAVPRVVALAKASLAAGAVFTGIALGFALYGVGALTKPVPRHDVLAGGVTAAVAIALVAAALYLERSCRARRPPEDEDEQWSQNGQRGHTL
jgi:peptidoglycan/LPS O-acetylase OafA/YrhL